MAPLSDRVSVIIPAFNAAGFVGDAIASIRSQTCQPQEIIVVDDASTDATAAVAAGLGSDIRILKQPVNLGPAATRNRGIKKAGGLALAFLDADDLWPVEAMAVLSRQLEQAPQALVAAGRINVIGDRLPARPIAEANKSLDGFALNFGCCLIRRQAFERVGLLEESLRFGEDTDWFMRAREHGVPITVVNEITLIYRRHGSNLTQDESHTMRIGLEMLKRSLDRRRAAGKITLPAWPVPSAR